MSRRFLAAVVFLSTVVGVLLGLVLASSLAPAPAAAVPPPPRVLPAPAATQVLAVPASVSFADIAERLNPAVVTVDATGREDARSRRRVPAPDGSAPPAERDRDGLRRGAGTGFIIDAQGHILTNQHVVDTAERLTVRLKDGRSLRAQHIGSDPDTDIALLKVDTPRPLPFVVLGDSDRLRVGDWVLAIGNPLAYEHTVTVGIVSFIGRKLFNASLDRYIQTDAAINFGNSGGPLINADGEVVGINTAISSRASNIGFAVPINQAIAILPQLRDTGRVARGYIGVALRDVDPDLQRSLQLQTSRGALVQDVTPGSPGARAGIRVYDLIVAVDGESVAGNEDLIASIAGRAPGTSARLHILRDNRPITIPVKLAERPGGERASLPDEADDRARPSGLAGSLVGLSVREIDREFAARTKLPDTMQGVIVSRVDPMSPAADAAIERGHLVLEINRRPVTSAAEYYRIVAQARPGDILAVQLYRPELLQRELRTLRLDD